MKCWLTALIFLQVANASEKSLNKFNVSPPPPSSERDLRTESVIVLVPYPRNDNFVGRAAIMKRLQQLRHDTFSQIKLSLFGLGGAG